MPKDRLSTPRNENVKSFLSANLHQKENHFVPVKSKSSKFFEARARPWRIPRCNVFSLKTNARSLRKKLINPNFVFYLKKNFKQYTLFISSRRTFDNFEISKKIICPHEGYCLKKNALQKNKIRSQLYSVCDPAGYLHELS